ncbi:hypothetical protein BT69DRAFT_1294193 [Atractiella rhizophila]|nr:hypothetical protein BT69DRAFT_1294193 [Atractiella rhizophila]
MSFDKTDQMNIKKVEALNIVNTTAMDDICLLIQTSNRACWDRKVAQVIVGRIADNEEFKGNWLVITSPQAKGALRYLTLTRLVVVAPAKSMSYRVKGEDFLLVKIA